MLLIREKMHIVYSKSKTIGMVCDSTFLIALLSLTIGILVLPIYPFISPLLFYGCYRIWKISDPPILSGYKTLKEVQDALQKKVKDDNQNSYGDWLEVRWALVEKMEREDHEKAA